MLNLFTVKENCAENYDVPLNNVKVVGVRQVVPHDLTRWSGYELPLDKLHTHMVVKVIIEGGESGEILVDLSDSMGDYSVR